MNYEFQSISAYALTEFRETPLKPHFHNIEKRGFAGVFLFVIQNIVGTRKNRLAEAVLTCTHNKCFERQ